MWNATISKHIWSLESMLCVSDMHSPFLHSARTAAEVFLQFDSISLFTSLFFFHLGLFFPIFSLQTYHMTKMLNFLLIPTVYNICSIISVYQLIRLMTMEHNRTFRLFDSEFILYFRHQLLLFRYSEVILYFNIIP